MAATKTKGLDLQNQGLINRYYMQLSKHFTLAEATNSETAYKLGLSNQPADDHELQVLKDTAEHMEKVRYVLDCHPIIVNSWFRSEEVNNAVGGVSNSGHRLGYAVDFTCDGFGNITDVCRAIKSSGIKVDQVIWEKGVWCHISFDPRYRMQFLTTHDASTYQVGIP